MRVANGRKSKWTFYQVWLGTGKGTKFGGYLSSSPTFLKYEIDIYWPIMKTKVTNNEYSLHPM